MSDEPEKVSWRSRLGIWAVMAVFYGIVLGGIWLFAKAFGDTWRPSVETELVILFVMGFWAAAKFDDRIRALESEVRRLKRESADLQRGAKRMLDKWVERDAKEAADYFRGPHVGR